MVRLSKICIIILGIFLIIGPSIAAEPLTPVFCDVLFRICGGFVLFIAGILFDD